MGANWVPESAWPKRGGRKIIALPSRHLGQLDVTSFSLDHLICPQNLGNWGEVWGLGEGKSDPIVGRELTHWITSTYSFFWSSGPLLFPFLFSPSLPWQWIWAFSTSGRLQFCAAPELLVVLLVCGSMWQQSTEVEFPLNVPLLGSLCYILCYFSSLYKCFIFLVVNDWNHQDECPFSKVNSLWKATWTTITNILVFFCKCIFLMIFSLYPILFI